MTHPTSCPGCGSPYMAACGYCGRANRMTVTAASVPYSMAHLDAVQAKASADFVRASNESMLAALLARPPEESWLGSILGAFSGRI